MAPAGATHAQQGQAGLRPLPRGLCQAARPADGADAFSPAHPACSLGTAEPACFTFCFRACFLPRDHSSLAFRLHIFLHRALPPSVPSLPSGRVINMQRMAPLLQGLESVLSSHRLFFLFPFLIPLFRQFSPCLLSLAFLLPSSFSSIFAPFFPSPSESVFSPISFPSLLR